MKTLFIVIGIAFVAMILLTVFYNPNNLSKENLDMQNDSDQTTDTAMTDEGLEPTITPISHASFVMEWDGITIYNDPVGEVSLYAGAGTPDIILLSDIHGDHLNTDTLGGIVTTETTIIAPQAVYDELTPALREVTTVVANGETINQDGLSFEALPMYNLPESDESRHTKGRGNGYVIGKDSMRVYIAGDTADIPEMRSLTGIDIAFVPMNLPYTMDVATAADAVIAFAPEVVIPYHYRGQEGLSDVDEFARLVGEGNPDIEVRLLNWYPTE